MAKKKKKRMTKKQRKQLWLGLLATALGMAVLLVLAIGLPEQPTSLPPETTAAVEETTVPPEPTLPSNPYGPEDFQYDGDYLTCVSGESRLGIDVSSHQGAVDWVQVKEAGVEFAMIRLGYRGYGSGVMKVDEYARENLAAAAAAGLDVGVYFFSQAISPEEARQEANFVLAVLKETELQMPVVFDWEYVSADARTGNMDRRTLTDCALTFCQVMEDAGYEVMLYFNQHLAQDFLILEELLAYDFWLAMYTDEMTCPYRIRMWQYTEEGSVPGISGNVDINLWLE